MSWQKGDIVDIKEEEYKNSYATRWFTDGRTGLTVKSNSIGGSCIVYQNKVGGNSWFISDNRLEPHVKDMEADVPTTDPKTWKRNKPMMCRVRKNGEWHRRHFARVNTHGKLLFYPYGKTSYSSRRSDNSENTRTYVEWREPTAEELK